MTISNQKSCTPTGTTKIEMTTTRGLFLGGTNRILLVLIGLLLSPASILTTLPSQSFISSGSCSSSTTIESPIVFVQAHETQELAGRSHLRSRSLNSHNRVYKITNDGNGGNGLGSDSDQDSVQHTFGSFLSGLGGTVDGGDGAGGGAVRGGSGSKKKMLLRLSSVAEKIKYENKLIKDEADVDTTEQYLILSMSYSMSLPSYDVGL